jgi:hypothetical protein
LKREKKKSKSWRSLDDVRNLASKWAQARANRDAASACMELFAGALESALRNDPCTVDRLKQFDARLARDVMRATVWRDMPLREVCERLKALGLPPWQDRTQETTATPAAGSAK